MSERAKAGLAALVIAGVFSLCGVGVYTKEMTPTAALATSLSALSSAGLLAAIVRGSRDDEDDEVL